MSITIAMRNCEHGMIFGVNVSIEIIPTILSFRCQKFEQSTKPAGYRDCEVPWKDDLKMFQITQKEYVGEPMELDDANVHQQWNSQDPRNMLDLLVNIASMGREYIIRRYNEVIQTPHNQ